MFRKRTSLVRAAWALAALLAILVFVKTFIGDVYHVDTASMEPTIHGVEGDGEWVFVTYDRSPAGRGEIVVLKRAGDTTPVVKRVVGLPGETVQLSRGDVLLNHRRLPAGAARPHLIALFDARVQDVSEQFSLAAQAIQPSKSEVQVWEVDVLDATERTDSPLMSFRGPIDDDYLSPSGARVKGGVQANDLAITCEVRTPAARGRLWLGLREQGDTFQVVLGLREGGPAVVSILRTTHDAAEVLATAEVAWSLGTWHSLDFSNVDNRLAFAIDGRSILSAVYTENHPHPLDVLASGKSMGERVFVDAQELRASLRSLVVLRDLCYAERGEYGVTAPIDLGPSEYYVLGDFSGLSRDSRDWGAVKASEIIGRASWVVWPWSQRRRIESVRVVETKE